MKVLLIAIHSYPSPQAVPLACAFLKAALLADPLLAPKLKVEIVECFADDSPGKCAAQIAERSPDLVGFSVYLWGAPLAARAARLLREKSPTLLLCAGGAEATANPDGLFAAAPFDFLIQGEGEGPLGGALARLLEGAPLEGVPGVVLPGGAPPPPAPPLSLERIPSPYLSGVLQPGRGDGALWQLARGCDFACSFCFDGKTSRKVRRFQLERVEAELSLLVQRGVSQVFVLDSTFNKEPQRAKAILRLIGKLAPRVHFHFEVRSEFLDREMAELFASITCSLQIGLQSAHREVLARVGRGFHQGDFAGKVELLNQSGAIFGFDLIYGLPGDTPERFRGSLDYALSLYPNHLDIFPLAVLPGTRLFGEAGEAGIVHLALPPYTITSTPGFSPEELEEAGRLARACDVFYTRGKAVAWFNSVRSGLKLSASSFLEEFAGWLQKEGAGEEEGLSDGEIWRLQRDFLTHIFPLRKKERLLPLALDLAYYHHLYGAALLAPPPVLPKRGKLQGTRLMESPLRVAPSAALARFNYPILEVLDAGEVDLTAFCAAVPKCASYAVIYPCRGEVRTEELPLPLFQLLERLDGRVRPGELCGKLKIPRREAISFLETALSEGIVLLPRGAGTSFSGRLP